MTISAKSLTLRAFMPYRLSIVSEVVSRVFSHHYEQRFNLTIPEWRVMAVLGENGEQSTQDVIERTQMDRVRVSRAVIRLADKALVTRQPDPDDQRAQRLTLSPAGSGIYQEIVPLAFALQAQLLQLLTAEEAVLLDRLLTKVEAGASQLEEDAILGRPR
jgi:DNA-binding MarR family transcriptional regulator